MIPAATGTRGRTGPSPHRPAAVDAGRLEDPGGNRAGMEVFRQMNETAAARGKPRIAMTLGDPAGIGAELVARLLDDAAVRERADVVILADAAELDRGRKTANAEFTVRHIAEPQEIGSAPVTLIDPGLSAADIARAEVSAEAGRHAIAMLETALGLADAGRVDAILFAPLNKSSLHLAQLGHADEGQWFAHRLGVSGAHGEVNQLDGLYTTRVTSHVALRDVADLITPQRIRAAIGLAHATLLAAGIAEPRIGVCGLNPHNGENGSFGREEIDVIGPAVAAAKAEGLPVEGPYPADTMFLRARDYDGIVTMYHDQGQIAMKLMGFSRGVTIQAGLPVPIVTPAHGTAFDLYGIGRADAGAIRAAFDIGVRMAAVRG
jgi:4-hydroxy-L-threonine phosphate dehydrogenase PdxA